ncbi:MAG: hypothetical protein AAGC64_02750 [Bacteroidota bacterium]
MESTKELEAKQTRILGQSAASILSEHNVVLLDPEKLIKPEKDRINSWVKAFENRQISKWDLKNGIYNTNESFESNQKREIAVFFRSIDKKLGITLENLVGFQKENQVAERPNQIVDNQDEVNAFFADIDKKLGINK